MAYSPPSHYASHTQRKQNKYTKHVELYGRPRPGSTAGNTNAELRRYGTAQFFATFAGKKEKKMIHSKQIT